MEDKMIKNLEEQSGKSLREWIAIVKAAKLEKHKQIIDHLKSNHGMTHGYANLVAHKARRSDAGSAGDTEQLVDKQYEKKENLRPIYEELISRIKTFGEDVEIAPKKAYVSLRRKKQFAILQPSTKSRLDVGINIKEKEAEGRLEASGSFNSMVSHRVRISRLEEVDKEVTNWLREAYEQAG